MIDFIADKLDEEISKLEDLDKKNRNDIEILNENVKKIEKCFSYRVSYKDPGISKDDKRFFAGMFNRRRKSNPNLHKKNIKNKKFRSKTPNFVKNESLNLKERPSTPSYIKIDGHTVNLSPFSPINKEFDYKGKLFI